MMTVVLAGPELPANVGFTARTMACHGLSDLRIVASPGIASHPDARRTASGGEAVLERTRYYPDLSLAVADCALAFGFSRRARDPGQRILDLPDAAALAAPAASQGGPDYSAAPIALVFGCESQGLSREDTLRLTHLVRIPLRDPALSLNLSHAVAIALYAFTAAPSQAGPAGPRAAAGQDPDTAPDPAPPAEGPRGEASRPVSLGESQSVLTAVLAALSNRGLFKAAKAEAQADSLRILWQRLQPTRRELEFLAGILKKLGS